MSKNLVLCLDGTWNGPDAKDKAGRHTPTNVQKVFECLSGSAPPAESTQVAKYIHGVGDDKNPLAKAIDGAVGLGLVARIVRGYTYLSRLYQPGDRIYIIGFSRGAYAARALSGLVVGQGLLDWAAMKLVPGSEESYSAGLAAWHRYKTTPLTGDNSIRHRLAEAVTSFHDLFELGLHPAPALQFVTNVSICAVGVWDTVGAMGIPDLKEADGNTVRVDAFEFADRRLNAAVQHGFHAVAIDEQRVSFTPTLWDARDGVVQVLFPGAHADVGGGYARTESGLSNGPLDWMARQLASVGVAFSAMPEGRPEAAATQHQPWMVGGVPFKIALRPFPPGLRLSQRVLQRLAAGPVQLEAQTGPGKPYRPKNLVNSYLLPDGTAVAPHVQLEP